MKYLIIGKKFGKAKKGGHIISKRFASNFPDHIEYKETSNAKDLEKLNKQYKRLIFITQVPSSYVTPVNIIKLLNINHVIYIREPFNFPTYNSCTNGFYYYINSNIKHFIPTITDFYAPQPKTIGIGFYAKNRAKDSINCFSTLIDNLPIKVNVYTMGIHLKYFENHKNVINYEHTYDNFKFFSNITHYVYPTSSIFIDPFPHSLLEATQCNKQIVIPTIKRNFKDGIDDIKDCIKWHEKIDIDNQYDNTNCILNAKNFNNFYYKIFDNNFEYNFNKLCYNNFYDWVVNEVL